jgi:hypothetical protein
LNNLPVWLTLTGWLDALHTHPFFQPIFHFYYFISFKYIANDRKSVFATYKQFKHVSGEDYNHLMPELTPELDSTSGQNKKIIEKVCLQCISSLNM